jgi:hypothetical protein
MEGLEAMPFGEAVTFLWSVHCSSAFFGIKKAWLNEGNVGPRLG